MTEANEAAREELAILVVRSWYSAAGWDPDEVAGELDTLVERQGQEVARAVLAAGWLPPETVTEARARELREAADAWSSMHGPGGLLVPWLRARADSLAPEAPSEAGR